MSTHFKLSVDIFLTSVRQVAYTLNFSSFCDALQFKETEMAESASCLFPLVYKGITFVDIESTQKEALYSFKLCITLSCMSENDGVFCFHCYQDKLAVILSVPPCHAESALIAFTLHANT